MKIKIIIVAAIAALCCVASLTNERDSLVQENIEAFAGISKDGTLYGDAAGTRFCCCPGTSYCGAAPCKCE